MANNRANFDNTPQLGDELWYRLPAGFFGEWVPAKVIDRSGTGALEVVYEPPIDEGSLHLEITLDRKRHYSSGTKGYRLNIEEGTGYGQWQREKPNGADIAVQKDREKAMLKIEANKEIMAANTGR